ncbi:hypothetical protein EYF80_045543 [Liparis tanakae]|uniref:Uncharacterized protein n=1 Tax=Liparis tanakae TaxID=230148 RepID=A0A4Z2FTQ5_9TELE|nr:hypothetical protein EYF80_045543 [Liparis tanakae]
MGSQRRRSKTDKTEAKGGTQWRRPMEAPNGGAQWRRPMEAPKGGAQRRRDRSQRTRCRCFYKNQRRVGLLRLQRHLLSDPGPQQGVSLLQQAAQVLVGPLGQALRGGGATSGGGGVYPVLLLL